MASTQLQNANGVARPQKWEGGKARIGTANGSIRRRSTATKRSTVGESGAPRVVAEVMAEMTRTIRKSKRRQFLGLRLYTNSVVCLPVPLSRWMSHRIVNLACRISILTERC